MDKILIFICAFFIAFICTPLVKKISIKYNIISIPKDKRRVHKKPIPLMGGLAIYISFIIVFIIVKLNDFKLDDIGLILGSTVILIEGILDDKFELRPIHKLAFQVTAAIILIIFGLRIENLTNILNSGNQYINIGFVSIPLTIIWVVGITNAINLIDGLDGLAAGLSFIFCVTIFIIAFISNRAEAMILTTILGGAILGFLPYNFNPASIFMGETGSALLGFLLAAISMEGAIKSAAAFTIVVPILALGLPIYDTLFAIVRRKINGKPIMQADRGHLHHRLLDMGLSHKQTVIIMYLISSVLSALAIIAMQLSNQRAYFLLASTAIILILIAWKFGFFEHKE